MVSFSDYVDNGGGHVHHLGLCLGLGLVISVYICVFVSAVVTMMTMEVVAYVIAVGRRCHIDADISATE